MVLARGGTVQKKFDKNKKKKGNGKLGFLVQKPLPKHFLCGVNYIIRDCPQWKAVKDAIPKKEPKRSLDPTTHIMWSPR